MIIKYTPHTRAADSLIERKDQIQSLNEKVNSLLESIQELLPVGKLMQEYSFCKIKQDRMKDQIDYLKSALEDLRKPDSSFLDEVYDSLLINIQTQISLCNSDATKLLDQITKAELDNVSHTVNLKLFPNIPLDSDLNQEAANDIVFSYIEKVRNINISYEKQLCQNNELSCYISLLNDEKEEYEKFKSETNEMIQNLEKLTEAKKIESEKQSQKFEKLKINEKSLINDFESRMELLKECSDYLIEKSEQSKENYDIDLLNSIKELFMKLQDPKAKDDDIKLTVKSIIHLSNLRLAPTPLNDRNSNTNNFGIDIKKDESMPLTRQSNDNNTSNNKYIKPVGFAPNQNINVEFSSSHATESINNTGFNSFLNSNKAGVNNSPTNFGFSSFTQNNTDRNISYTTTTNNNYANNTPFASFNMERHAQNSSNPTNSPSCHEILISLQQRIDKLNKM